MDHRIDHASTFLDAGTVQRLPHVDGLTVAVLSGTVWITQDHDLRDFVLAPGDTHTFHDGERDLLIEALQPARFFLLAPMRARRRDRRVVARQPEAR